MVGPSRRAAADATEDVPILLSARRTSRVTGLRLRLAAVASIAAVAPARTAHADDAPSRTASTKMPATAAVPPSDSSTERVSLEMASYTDSDRITVFTPSIAGTIQNVTSGATLHGSYLVDVVSAASVDIVSTASRRWSEVRQAGALSAEYKPQDFGIGVAGSLSIEPDYRSTGLAVQVTHDFDEKNTTLAFGYGWGHDTLGRSGTPYEVFSRELQRGTFNGGITQIIDRSTVMALTVDAMFESGDQSKPYRYIPMFAPEVAAKVPLGASIDWVTANRLPERPLEQLPLSRRRFAFTNRWAHRFDASTLKLEERVYYDTWALMASTTDARWIFDVSRRLSLWPHLRFHAQSGASFWKRAYVSGPAPGWNLPELRTGDRELGPLRTATGGAGFKWLLGKGDPQSLSITAQGDVGQTSFLNAIYVTSRTSVLGALTLEGAL